MSMLLCRFCLFKDNLQSIHDFMKVCPKFLKVMNLIFNIKVNSHKVHNKLEYFINYFNLIHLDKGTRWITTSYLSRMRRYY